MFLAREGSNGGIKPPQPGLLHNTMMIFCHQKFCIRSPTWSALACDLHWLVICTGLWSALACDLHWLVICTGLWSALACDLHWLVICTGLWSALACDLHWLVICTGLWSALACDLQLIICQDCCTNMAIVDLHHGLWSALALWSTAVSVLHRYAVLTFVSVAPPYLCSTVSVLHRICAPPYLCSTVSVLHRICAPPYLCSTISVLHRICAPPYLCGLINDYLLHRALMIRRRGDPWCTTRWSLMFHKVILDVPRTKTVPTLRLSQLPNGACFYCLRAYYLEWPSSQI